MKSTSHTQSFLWAVGHVLVTAAALCLTSAAQAATDYSYDGAGRITSATYDDNTQVQYRYDSAGNIVERWTNNLPVAVADAFATMEDIAVTTSSLTANDTDIDASDMLAVATLEAVSAEGGSVVNVGDGTAVYTPPLDFSGSDSFSYQLTDGRGGLATGTVTITISPVPDPPNAISDFFTTDEDFPLDATSVLTNDVDPDPGDTISLVSMAATTTMGGAITNNGDGTFRYVPPIDFNGVDDFDYTVQDSSMDMASATVTITVRSVDDAPVAGSDSVSTLKNAQLDIATLLDNDTDVDVGDTLSITAVGNPSTMGGTVLRVSATAVSYTPSTDFVGSDTFTYEVSDTTGNSVTGNVTVDVRATNLPPSAAILVFPADGAMDIETTVRLRMGARS